MNSLASTRRGSGRSRWPLRRTSMDARRPSRAHELARVLQRGDHGQRRFGALVLVASRRRGARRSRLRWRARRAACRRRCRRGTSATARSTACAHRTSPVIRRARAHASASAATSIGCWSKPGRASPSDHPPARASPTGDRRASRRRRASRAAAARRRGRARHRGCSPAAMSASGRAALAYVRRASGHGHDAAAGRATDRRGPRRRAAPARPGRRVRPPGSPPRRARRTPSTVGTGSASGRCGRTDRRRARRTAPSVARAAAVPRPHRARPQQSSTPGSSFHRRSRPRRL